MGETVRDESVRIVFIHKWPISAIFRLRHGYGVTSPPNSRRASCVRLKFSHLWMDTRIVAITFWKLMLISVRNGLRIQGFKG